MYVILMIVDHGCSRAEVFLPCTTTISGPGIAQLYLDNVYRWFGLPSKIISNRDPQFMERHSLKSWESNKTYPQPSTPKWTDSLNGRINRSSNIYEQ